jgi:hypothetical protein
MLLLKSTFSGLMSLQQQQQQQRQPVTGDISHCVVLNR